jgi:hypothetical protein
LGGVFGERHVSDVVPGFDLPVVAGQPGELGGCGLFGGEAGDGVDGLDADLVGAVDHLLHLWVPRARVIQELAGHT